MSLSGRLLKFRMIHSPLFLRRIAGRPIDPLLKGDIAGVGPLLACVCIRPNLKTCAEVRQRMTDHPSLSDLSCAPLSDGRKGDFGGGCDGRPYAPLAR